MRSGLTRLADALTLARRRQRRAHLAEALTGTGMVAVWASALSASPASVWFALGLGVCWYLWRDATVIQGGDLDLDDVARWLDHRYPALEESSTLLLETELRGLRALQRERIAPKLGELSDRQLIAAIPLVRHRVLPVFVLLGGLAIIPLSLPDPGGAPTVPPASDTDEFATLGRVLLQVTPPAYTALSPFTDDAREVTVPEGATITWGVETRGNPTAVSLAFDDEQRVELTQDAPNRWSSPPWPARASVYRVLGEVPWGRDDRYRIVRVSPDRPPDFEFTMPTRTVTALSGSEASPTFTIAVTVTDDYGLRDVSARLTLASGGGENVRFREQSVTLAPLSAGTRRTREYQHRFDLRALSMEPGDELYVHLEATDNRQPVANLATSRTWIVRWPAETYGEQDEVEVMAMRVMPEYFRSQRQIIIDTEALLASADQLTPEGFAGRAQAIAFDQKALRLRYGTFLGEEAVTDIGPGAMPDQDDPPLHYPGDGHDHGDDEIAFGAANAPRFGQLDTVLAQFGHTHDQSEQATLFDPQTRDLLKAALAQMWDAELHLRLSAPTQALPFEYEALDLIKRVQQRSRIYLRRVGFRTTPPDEARRFSGDLDELTVSRQSRFPTAPEERLLAQRGLSALVGILDGEGAPPAPALLDELSTLLRSRTDERMELLSAIGAVEALRTAPGCKQCAEQLAQGLFRFTPAPLRPAQARMAPTDAVARAYAGALASESR